jgi:Transposase DDE domain
MAHGSSRRMRTYVNKVFDVEARLATLTDCRREPMVPQAPLLQTWFWALAKRVPSTEQLGDMLRDPRWRHHVGLADDDGGSPDTAVRVLDQLVVDEINELALDLFFTARRVGILDDGGPYGLRCAIVDLNELFSSTKVHCPHCQVREKTVGEGDNKQVVKEYYHQAVALVWAGEITWPIGWELLQPGEGELTAALRLLARLLPKLRKSLDLVLGDALYCCRPFFSLAKEQGIDALAVSSGVTEMDEEIELLMRTEPATVGANEVAYWSMESERWEREVGCQLRVTQYENRAASKSWRHERKALRVVTTMKVDLLPVGQGWKAGRCRWEIEDDTFNALTRNYHLEHNYHHNVVAMLALLVLRSLAMCMTFAYYLFATARSRHPPRTFDAWWSQVLVEDWVRYLDEAAAVAAASPAVCASG